MRKISAISILILLIIGALTISSSSAEESKSVWWTQGFTAEQTTETQYQYDSSNMATPSENITADRISFFDISVKTLTDFSPLEQEIYQAIDNAKKENPAITYAALKEKVTATTQIPEERMIENVIGFHEFSTATGYFAYLNNPPAARDREIYDAWFTMHATKYPTPPTTKHQWDTITTEIHTNLAQQFQCTPDDISDVVYRIEKYQDKHKLPKNIPISEAVQHAENKIN